MFCWYLSNNPNSRLLYMYIGEYFSLVLLIIIVLIILILFKLRNDYPTFIRNRYKREKKSDVLNYYESIKLGNIHDICYNSLFYQYRHPIRYCDDWFRKFLGWRISSTVLVCYSFYFTLWILSTISILSSYIVRRPALTDYFRSRKTNICSGQNILCEKIIWKKGGGKIQLYV